MSSGELKLDDYLTIKISVPTKEKYLSSSNAEYFKNYFGEDPFDPQVKFKNIEYYSIYAIICGLTKERIREEIKNNGESHIQDLLINCLKDTTSIDRVKKQGLMCVKFTILDNKKGDSSRNDKDEDQYNIKIDYDISDKSERSIKIKTFEFIKNNSSVNRSFDIGKDNSYLYPMILLTNLLQNVTGQYIYLQDECVLSGNIDVKHISKFQRNILLNMRNFKKINNSISGETCNIRYVPQLCKLSKNSVEQLDMTLKSIDSYNVTLNSIRNDSINSKLVPLSVLTLIVSFIGAVLGANIYHTVEVNGIAFTQTCEQWLMAAVAIIVLICTLYLVVPLIIGYFKK